MKNDRIAHLSLVHDAEQNHVAQHQVKQANETARQRKQDANDKFWSNVFFFGTGALVLIVLAFLYQIIKG